MSFHLSAWSVKNPVPTLVLFLTLSIVGFFSFLQLGINDQPNIDLPTVQVSVTQAGAGPTELETQVTKKVEDAVAGLGDIDKINSTVTDGSSKTTIQFVLGTDANQATNEVRNAIAQIRTQLPEAVDEPIVQKLEFAGGSVMTYAVSSPRLDVEELSDLVDRTISRKLLAVSGVAQVERLGGVDREIRVNLDPQRLQAYKITATDVNDQIRRFNINLPGGRSEVAGGEQNIRTLGSANTVEELQQYPIRLTGNNTVPLAELGEVLDSFGEPRQAAWLNNQPVVAFSILRSTGSTLVTVADKVQVAVAELQTELGDEAQMDLIFTRASAIRGSYQATMDAVLIGSVLTVITVWLFLRNWRMTLITAMALPLSIIPTFLVMRSLDYTLNGMTLLALALAMGNLVDDAICMIENIDQHLAMGKMPLRAAIDGAREIGLAVVTTTATIVAVFLPVAFMGGIPGQFFQPFGVTVAVSTLFSTLVATTMTPMLSAYILRPKFANQSGVASGQLATLDRDLQNLQTAFTNERSRRRPYQGLLTWALRHRLFTLGIAIAFFIGSLQLVPFIPKGLFSNGDTALSTVLVELPPGSTLAETNAVLQKATRILQDNTSVTDVLARATEVNEGTMYVKLIPKNERMHQREFEKQMRSQLAEIPGARLAFRSQGAGGGAKDLSLILKSDNGQLLSQTASALEREVRTLPGFVEVSSSDSLVKPELIVEPDPQRAADLGVSVQAIARTASLALLGDNEASLAKFNLPDRQIPIRVQIDAARRQDIETIKSLEVPGRNAQLIPLSAVATLRLGSGPAEIQRFDRARQVSLEANLEGLSLGEAITQVRELPAINPLPPGVFEEPAGDAEIMRDIFTRFSSALGLAVLAIYAILVLLYDNFLYPFGILAALPLSIGGALIGLLIAQKELGLFALIGIVLLMGLVTKNAILLVDSTLERMRQGQPQFRALIDAGISRLRPILMTSVSTIAGMTPIAMELGADGEVRSPMAIAVIGGFTTSTLLTLVVVPVLFTYIDSLVRWIGKWLQAKTGEHPSNVEVPAPNNQPKPMVK